MTLVSFFLYEASFDGEALTPLKVEAGGRPLSCANRFSLPRAACATGTDLPQGRPELLWLPGRQAGVADFLSEHRRFLHFSPRTPIVSFFFI